MAVHYLGPIRNGDATILTAAGTGTNKERDINPLPSESQSEIFDNWDTRYLGELWNKNSRLVECAVDSATVIEPNDMVYLDTDDVKPASDFPWDTDLATTQIAFARVFLGVAIQGSANGETRNILVETSPDRVFQNYNVHTFNYEVGDSLGPDENSSKLMNQKLEGATEGCSIARVVKQGTNLSQVDVTFASAYHTGSANYNGLLAN